jgi:FkbM family methyltransferase
MGKLIAAKAFRGSILHPVHLHDARPNDQVVHLRLGTTDPATYRKVFVEEEYRVSPGKRPHVILDAGANIGLTSIYFARRFPDATIIAIEPERSNVDLLMRNVAPYGNVRVVEAALWSEECELQLEDPGIGKWGFRVERATRAGAPSHSVRGITVETMLNDFGLERIDVLKLDIEGAEREVLAASAAWIDRVGILVAELHDRYKEGCSRNYHLATRGFDYEWVVGENVFAARGEYTPVTLPDSAVRLRGGFAQPGGRRGETAADSG